MAASHNLLFAPPPVATVPVLGEEKLFPVNRIFCVGRNYVEHAKEMGGEVDREAPFYFMKFANAIVHSGATVPYPPGTKNCHYEMEFVVAIGAPAFRIAAKDAMSIVCGYATGLDMTRRDLQAQAKEKGRPWDLAKSYEQSAIISPITRAAAFGAIGDQRICMQQNGTMKQDARLSDMVWAVPDIIDHLSRYYHLEAGDLIYTGTPAGVGAIQPGDTLFGEIEGLSPVKISFGAAE
ncbi:MAG: fumarylacetoacetate hydrolase family protein [Bosea sp. (in: a-proteobacteria)]